MCEIVVIYSFENGIRVRMHDFKFKKNSVTYRACEGITNFAQNN